MRSLKGTLIEVDDITLFANHPAIKFYPNLIPDLLKNGPGNIAANEFTFLFKIAQSNFQVEKWNNSPWHSKDENSLKWRLRLWKKQNNVYTTDAMVIDAMVEPNPKKSTTVQIFRLKNGVDECSRQEFTGKYFCKFSLKHPENSCGDLSFGVTIIN